MNNAPQVITESEFQATVVEMAEALGWKVFGVLEQRQYARRLSKGYPDLTLVKPPYIIWAELKSGKGRLRGEQQEWLDTLRACMKANPKLWVQVWYPKDMDLIEAILRLGGAPAC